jgi:hypothetical protein
MLRIPQRLENRLTDGGKVVNTTHRQRSAPQKNYFFCFWYSFLLEAEYTPEPSEVGRTKLKNLVQLIGS